MSDCIWPIPYSQAPASGPRWELLKCDASSEIQARVAEGAAKLRDLRRHIVDFFAAKDPPLAAVTALVEQTLKPYAQLTALANLHLDCAALGGGASGGGGGKAGKEKPTKIVWDDAWTHQERVSNSLFAELAWTLFDVVAALSVSASKHVSDGSPDALKLAFQDLQSAAGYVGLLREQVLVHLPEGDRIGMLSTESLEYCEVLLVASAGHVFVLRAEKLGSTKRSLMQKLWADVGEAYQRLCGRNVPTPGSAKSASLANMQAFVQTGAAVSRARAHALVGDGLLEEHEAGPAIAHYRTGVEAIDAVLSRGGGGAHAPLPAVLASWLMAEKSRIGGLFQVAVKRNETVYFGRVPAAVDAVAGFGKVKAAPTKPPALHQLVEGPNPFIGVVPAKVQAAANQFKQVMAAQLAAKQREVLAQRKKANDAMTELGVAGVIATLTSETEKQCKLPDGLRNKILALRSNVADGSVVAYLVNLVGHTHQVCESITDLCSETISALDAEAAEDEEYASQFGVRVWRPLRKPSDELPDVARLRTLVRDTRNAVASEISAPLQQAKVSLESQSQYIVRLDWPMEDLDALMPFRDSARAVESRGELLEAAQHLAGLVSRIDRSFETQDANFAEVQTVIQSQRAARALMATPGADTGALDDLQAEIIDRFSVVDASGASLDQLLQEVEATMVKVASQQSADPIAAEVQKVCAELEKALELHASVAARLSELGNRASIQLDEATLLRNTARGIQHGRHLEATELAESLEREIASRVAAMSAADAALSPEQLASRRRQEELRAEIDRLEQQRQQRHAAAAAPPASNAPPSSQPAAAARAPPPTFDPFAPPPPSQRPGGFDPFAPPPVAPDYNFTGAPANAYHQGRQPTSQSAPPPPPGPPPPSDNFDAFFQ